VKLDMGLEDEHAVEYRKSGFISQSPDRALARAQNWQRGPSETYAREAWKLAGQQSFPNAPAEVHQKAHDEIAGADMKPPAPPDLLGGPAPKFDQAVPGGIGGKKKPADGKPKE
jgi:hypothetical protein